MLIELVTRHIDQLLIYKCLPLGIKYCYVESAYYVCKTLYSILLCSFNPFAVKNILHKLLILNEIIPGIGAVDEARPVQLRKRLQFTITFL